MIKKIKEFKRRGGDVLDPFHLKCDITVARNLSGKMHRVRAAINTEQFNDSVKTTEPISVKYWDFTKEMMSDPKGKIAIHNYKKIMESARKWLEKELNIYKFPSH